MGVGDGDLDLRLCVGRVRACGVAAALFTEAAYSLQKLPPPVALIGAAAAPLTNAAALDPTPAVLPFAAAAAPFVPPHAVAVTTIAASPRTRTV